jgi:hypothetical protein
MFVSVAENRFIVAYLHEGAIEQKGGTICPISTNEKIYSNRHIE